VIAQARAETIRIARNIYAVCKARGEPWLRVIEP